MCKLQMWAGVGRNFEGHDFTGIREVKVLLSRLFYPAVMNFKEFRVLFPRTENAAQPNLQTCFIWAIQ